MIKWFKRNWNEPLTIGNLVKMSGWLMLASIVLVYPVCWLTMQSFVIASKFGDFVEKVQNRLSNPNRENDFEDET